jgi:hypothetical protein
MDDATRALWARRAATRAAAVAALDRAVDAEPLERVAVPFAPVYWGVFMAAVAAYPDPNGALAPSAWAIADAMAAFEAAAAG